MDSNISVVLCNCHRQTRECETSLAFRKSFFAELCNDLIEVLGVIPNLLACQEGNCLYL